MKNLKKKIEIAVIKAFGSFSRSAPPCIRVRLKRRFFDRHIAWRRVDITVKAGFGASLSLRFPDYIQNTIFLTGVWEPCLTRIIETALRPGDIFVDVGANIGYYSLLAASRVSHTGKVYAIEASPLIYRLLRENLDRNAYWNVLPINKAVSNESSECEIYMAPESNLGHSSIIADSALIDGSVLEGCIECEALPSLIPIDDLLRARFIKIDIEGAERLALEGLVSLLPRFSYTTEWLIELSPSFLPGGQTDADWIFQLFMEHGYRAYIVPNDYTDDFMLGDGKGYRLCRVTEAPAGALSDLIFSRMRGSELGLCI